MPETVIEWDGTHLPSELRELPPGRYVVAPLDGEIELSEEEDAAVRLGLDQAEAGQVVPYEQVMRKLRERIAELGEG
jgi:predicted transcriptional regulator